MRFLREFEVYTRFVDGGQSWKEGRVSNKGPEGRGEGTQPFTAEENRGPWLK